MKNTLITIVTTIALLFSATAFSQNTQAGEYERGKACYQNLLKQGKNATNQEWQKCISFFEKFKTSSALFSTGRLQQEHYAITHAQTDLEGAIKNFNELIRQFPKSSLADDALYRIGCMRQDLLNQKDRARRSFSYILEKYPDGDMAVHAKARLAALGDEPAEEKPAVVQAPIEETEVEETSVIKEGDLPATKRFSGMADAFNRATLTGVSIGQSDKGATVELNLDRDVEYSVEYTELGRRTRSPPELDIVLLHAKAAGDLTREATFASAYIASYKIKNLLLSSGIRITFTLTPQTRYEVTKRETGLAIRFGNETKASPSPSSSLSSFRIVIDPGHGGEDEGAVGPSGTLEKDITLAMAKPLAKRLRGELSANVWLTRNDDRTLTLEQRNTFAVGKKADLFISIHANASTDKSASGIETYYLNNATDEAAAKLAARENSSSGKKLSEVEHIISTMLQNYDAAQSLDLATEVQAGLTKRIKSSLGKVKNRGVRSAMFYVLVGAKCPAILVEAAFISNPKEEQLLKDKKYQKNVATAITDGVKKYLKLREKELVSL
ncbi:MAG: N-acetylmuramoyl-L-alanine amidase [Pseudomonadota bacterium]